MSSMLDPQKYNAEKRQKDIDLTIQAMGPTNEKSAFLLAVLAKQSDDPIAYLNEIGKYIDAVYAAGENTDTAIGSTFSSMQDMYRGARSIYEKIKNI
ncbi:hypothetical protein AAGQ96_12895 [Pantoea sp. MBD-2R]|uniref:hypothetical protein n=1 Tax=Pantoea sp. MBD-2R TaxID=3141540 RepID=UPI003182C7AE